MYQSMLAHRDVTIGPGVVVGVGTIIGKAVIEEGVLFGARVSLLSGKYQHGRPDRRTPETPGGEFTSITIGAHSWIGQQAVIMSNVGRNCTVGAGSVLMKDAPDNTTFMGNPARKVNIEPRAETRPDKSEAKP
jgi:acetyltransferase-like isoleucine patch superfamily enzyme